MTLKQACLLMATVAFFVNCDFQFQEYTSMVAQPPKNERTCFQTNAPWDARIDLQSDVAIIYSNTDTARMREKIDTWRDKGYTIHVMTAVGRGAQNDYVSGNWQAVDGNTDGQDHSADIQLGADGAKFDHGSSSTLYYIVPTLNHTEFLKRAVKDAIDCGARALHLEEPEFWAGAGYSDGFKNEWRKFYNEAWQDPKSSPEAWLKSAELKVELYYRTTERLYAYAKSYAQSKGIENFRCYVPTHSLLNYTQWGIVSPETRFVDMVECDGFIGQVWTGTARSRVEFNGIRKERTFENAYLEYSSLKNMVRNTNKSIWFLADPIEDNPQYDWDDYRDNYQKTLVASLLHPDIHSFEVMPWPHRVFYGKYPSNARNAKSIPADYAAELMTINNLLSVIGDFPDYDYSWYSGTRHIGVMLSDAMMLMSSSPWASPIESFHQLAFSLMKTGMPVEVIPMDRCRDESYLTPYNIILMSYEGQKPLRPDFHPTLIEWIENGGVLIFFGAGTDEFDAMNAWWNTGENTAGSPREHLFESLNLGENPKPGLHECGRGAIYVSDESPAALSAAPNGAEPIQNAVKDAIRFIGNELYDFHQQNYIYLKRGPLVIAAAMDESITDHSLELSGHYIDIFDPALPIIEKKVLNPGEQLLLYDLSKVEPSAQKVLLSASRIRNQTVDGRNLSFTSRGPVGVTCHTLVKLVGMPPHINLTTADGTQVQTDIKWHIDDQVLRLVYPNSAKDILVELFWNKTKPSS